MDPGLSLSEEMDPGEGTRRIKGREDALPAQHTSGAIQEPGQEQRSGDQSRPGAHVSSQTGPASMESAVPLPEEMGPDKDTRIEGREVALPAQIASVAIQEPGQEQRSIEEQQSGNIAVRKEGAVHTGRLMFSVFLYIEHFFEVDANLLHLPVLVGKKKSDHKRKMPTKKPGGIGSRTLKGKNNKSSLTRTNSNASSVSVTMSLPVKLTPKQYGQKISDLTKLRDNWKEKCGNAIAEKRDAEAELTSLRAQLAAKEKAKTKQALMIDKLNERMATREASLKAEIEKQQSLRLSEHSRMSARAARVNEFHENEKEKLSVASSKEKHEINEHWEKNLRDKDNELLSIQRYRQQDRKAVNEVSQNAILAISS